MKTNDIKNKSFINNLENQKSKDFDKLIAHK